MTPRRVLLLEKRGTYRSALERVLAVEGHELRVAEAVQTDLLREFRPDVVLAGHEEATVRDEGIELIVLERPLNLEELRQVLRDRPGAVAEE